jgi:hypothetical protein
MIHWWQNHISGSEKYHICTYYKNHDSGNNILKWHIDVKIIHLEAKSIGFEHTIKIMITETIILKWHIDVKIIHLEAKSIDLHIMLKSCLKTKITDLPTFEKSHCRNDQNAGFTHFFHYIWFCNDVIPEMLTFDKIIHFLLFHILRNMMNIVNCIVKLSA